MTHSGLIVGTPAYMAPEQATRGRSMHGRDLFSLGCVLYRISTGEPPFAGATAMAVLAALRMDDPRPVRDVNPEMPEELSCLVMRLLAKDPTARPASAREVIEQIKAIEEKGNHPAREMPAVGPAFLTTARSSKPRRWVAALAAGLLATAAIAAAVIVFQGENGMVRIETVDPDIEVVLTSNGRTFTIKDQQTKESVTLPVGKYEVELTRGKKGLKLETKAFLLKRGDETVVKVTWAAANEPTKIVPTGEPMSQGALVRRPAKIAGVESWTIETISPRGWCGCVLSADGKRLATFGADGAIRIWDANDGKLQGVFHGPTFGAYAESYRIDALAWAPDGMRLASLDRNDKLRIWNVGTGQQLRTANTGAHRVHLHNGASIAWSPDGKTLATGHEGGVVYLWDAKTAKKSDLLKYAFNTVANVIEWSPSSQMLALASVGEYRKGEVEIWDTQTGNRKKTLEVALQSRYGLGWSHDDKTVCILTADRKYKIVTVAIGNITNEIKGAGGKPCFSTDDKAIQLSSGVWDLTFGKHLRPLQSERLLRVLPTNDKIPDNIISWSADGRRLVANNNGWKVWDAATGKVVCRLPEEVAGRYAYDFSPDRKSLAMSIQDGPIRIWELSRGGAQVVSSNLGRDYNGITWSPDGQYLLVGGGPAGSFLFQTKSWKARGLSLDGRVRPFVPWSLDSKTFVAAKGAHGSPDICVWDVDSNLPRQALEGTKGNFWLASMSPDGKWIAMARDPAASHFDDKSIGIWEAATGKRVRVIDGKKGTVLSLAWSPDGQFLASGHKELVRIWDPHTGKLLRELKGPKGWGQTMSWSSDSKTVISIEGPYYGGTIRQWDHRTSKELRTAKGPAPSYGPYSADRKLLAVPFPPAAATIWDLAKNQELGVVVGLPREQSIAISPDGHYRGSPCRAAHRLRREDCEGPGNADAARVRQTLRLEERSEQGAAFGELNEPHGSYTQTIRPAVRFAQAPAGVFIVIPARPSSKLHSQKKLICLVRFFRWLRNLYE